MATRRAVAQMANGGLHPPAGYASTTQDDAELAKHVSIVRQAHAGANGSREIKYYDIAKRLKDLPGTHHASSKNKKNKGRHASGICIGVAASD